MPRPSSRVPSFRLLMLAGLALLVLVAHLPLRHSEYIQDDRLAVVKNQIVARGDLAEILSTSYWEGAEGHDRSLYRPLVIFSYALERKLTGQPAALVAHVVNLVLHFLVVALLMTLMLRLGAGRLAAGAAAALFAVHPVHVEAIAGIVGRADLLAALGSLSALQFLTYAGSWGTREPSALARRLAAGASGICLFLALGSKEVAFATPFLMVAVELLLRPYTSATRSGWWARLGALIPGGIAGLLYLALRVRALEMFASVQPVHPMDNILVRIDGAERLFTSFGIVARYVRLLLSPTRLSADYSGNSVAIETTWLAARPLIGAFVLLALLLLIAWPFLSRRLRRTAARPATPPALQPLAAFAALMFLMPYLVIGNLFFIVGAAVAERFMYLPSIGSCMLLGLLFEQIRRLPPLAGRSSRQQLQLVIATVAILSGAFALMTWNRCRDWRDEATLFRSATLVTPDSPRPHLIVGHALVEEGDPAGAIPHFDQILAQYPRYTNAWMERGIALAALGRFAEAEGSFRTAVEISPGHYGAHLNLALALRHQGHHDRAERSLKKALAWQPRASKVWAELGNLYLERERYREAAEAYRQAIALGRHDLRPRLEIAERELQRRP